MVKSGGQIADEFHYSPVNARDRTWCRLPARGSDLTFTCIPTPGLPNIAYAGGLAESDDNRIYGLPDTVPAEIVLAECEGVGDGVWNEGMKVQFWLNKQGKWDLFVE